MTMSFADYATKYQTVHMDRSSDGVLEVRLHSRGGEAQWGTSEAALHRELGLAFADIGGDLENKVMILTGTGSNFIVAMDPQERAAEATLGVMWDRIYREGLLLLENLLAIPVPIIAAVNGPAHIHAELAVLSDIVLAAEHAEFADLTHFVRGAVPGDGVQVVWPMLLGPNQGRYFLLTGQRLSAVDAHRLGVVGEVLPAARLLSRARELGTQLARLPGRTLRHTRSILVRDLRRRMREDLDLGLAVEALAMV
jgi:enoyl-CoA hydratase/carnithine racemase